jgi:hypothetical protein
LAYIQGEARGQQALFPSTLDELIAADHVCRVIQAFVGKLDMEGLGFLRAEPAETGRISEARSPGILSGTKQMQIPRGGCG